MKNIFLGLFISIHITHRCDVCHLEKLCALSRIHEVCTVFRIFNVLMCVGTAGIAQLFQLTQQYQWFTVLVINVDWVTIGNI